MNSSEGGAGGAVEEILDRYKEVDEEETDVEVERDSNNSDLLPETEDFDSTSFRCGSEDNTLAGDSSDSTDTTNRSKSLLLD